MSLEILPPGALQVERMPDGRRKLLRPLILELDGEQIVIPSNFETDYSSWPRWLPGPNYSRVDLAGVVHDYCFKHATLGLGGREVGYVESNRVWYRIAKAGTSWTKCPLLWALAGRAGLFVGAWWQWYRYRSQDA